METASFNGFIKTLFYIFAFYYVFKFLARLFLPIVVKKVVEKAEESFKQQQNYNESSRSQNTTNGDQIIYDTAKTTKPKETKKVGDYVDYEEID